MIIKGIQRAILLAWLATAAVSAQNLPSAVGQPDSWYKTAEARKIAENLLSYQSDWGGWLKNTNTVSEAYTGTQADLHPTFDNGATTDEMRFLAKIYNATGEQKFLEAFQRALDYVLVAQYPTGGWPQSYPPPETYHRYVTFNDNAMVRVLALLRDIYSTDTFEFLAEERREAARSAFQRGIDYILKAQVKVNGKLTAWSAQHDELDYRPRPARAFELTSLSGNESVGIVRILMDAPASPEIKQAIEAAVAWFEEVAIDDAEARKLGFEGKSTPTWARFYEIETNRPLFSDRGSEILYKYSEVGEERRKGYAWFGNWPASLLDREYPAWKKRGGKPEREYRSSVEASEPAVRIGVAGDLSVTDRAGWAFGLKKALTNKALYFDFAGASGDTGADREKASAGKGIAETDSPRGNPQRKRPALGSEEWWKQVEAAKPAYLLLQFDRADDSDQARGGEIVKMIQRAQAANIAPVLITPLPKVSAGAKDNVDLDPDPAARTVERLARERKVPLIDLHAVALEAVPKLDPATARSLFLASAEGYSREEPGQLTPWGKEEFGALVGGELLKKIPELGTKLGMQQPALVSRMAGAGPAGEAAVASKAPPESAQKAIRDRVEAAAARIRAAQAAREGLQIESDPMLLVVKSPENKLQMRRARAAIAQEKTVLARLADGTQAAWSMAFVVGQIPWQPDPESEKDNEKLVQLAERYDAASKRFPGLRADFEVEASALRDVVSRRERRAAMEAALAELLAIKYEPTKNYTIEELEAIFRKAEPLRLALTDREGEIESALAPFRTHLARIEAGDRLVEGTWRKKEQIEQEELAKRLKISLEGVALDPDRLWNALLPVALLVIGAAVLGVGLIIFRKTRIFGVISLSLLIVGLVFCRGLLYGDSGKKQTANSKAGDATKAARLFVISSRGNPPAEENGEILLSNADLNAFVADHVVFSAEAAPPGALRRTDLSVELTPKRMIIHESLRLGRKPIRANYVLVSTPVASGSEFRLQSVKAGNLAVPESVGSALWGSLKAELGKLGEPVLRSFDLVRLDQDGLLLRAVTKPDKPPSGLSAPDESGKDAL